MINPTRQFDKRCETGIEGLNEILGEGLPANCLYLVQGDPGSGKTTLALQFLLEGVRLGEKTLYITLSETKDELVKVARSHGWALDSIALFKLVIDPGFAHTAGGENHGLPPVGNRTHQSQRTVARRNQAYPAGPGGV